ncbi:hypothetical protein C1893_23310 [Pseudomonas sp. MPR-ANC1]|uniref:hypothetical protein n=1 Tax=Pseudomonas sp. MPR-ANC1 TaxID=2075548 RepID=UPI000CD1722E|nr:hypothetical protein [Pseudomonas sp. MPR-ANC1]POA45587.1 hypothetical protein C1893_23310 [Pseudomonas sp. MPR-ANC1]
MAKKLTVKQMEGRYEALNEAAEHLLMDWTNVPSEFTEGRVVSDKLKKEAAKWLARAEAAREAESEENR